VGNREALTGILFVLKTGIAWEDLPKEMGCGSGMTCWRRLVAWHKAGVWDKLHHILLEELQRADQIDWSRAIVECGLEGPDGRQKTGPNPTDRSKCGSKHHIITDANGIPLAVVLTGANTHDVTQLIPLVDGIVPVRGKPGRPRQRPERVQGDRGYDSEPHRKQLRKRKIEPVLAERYTEHGSGLGVFRWVVERTLAWFHQFRRLRTRYDRRDDIHEAFMSLGCAMICFNYLD
jgi:transposase